MFRIRALVAAMICCWTCIALAGPTTYRVTINTSSLAGTAGSLDLNFNPGPLASQSASVQIVDFDGTLAGSPTLTGDVSGTLPATVTFNNGSAFNDYFQGFKYGSTITFNVTLYGPALSSPSGSSSGSTFAFSMFSDQAGTIPVLTTDTTDGFAFLINVNLNGTTTVTNYSLQTSIVAAATTTCKMTGVVGGPPKQIQITMQDAGSGLKTIQTTSSVNATVHIPSFVAGTKSPILVTATKVNQSESSDVAFTITNDAGATLSCDPVDFTAAIENGVETHVFRKLNDAEHYIRVLNGHPGLSRVTFIVNGRRFSEMALGDDATRVLDVDLAMHEGTDNLIVMEASGRHGASAYILIGDASIE